MITGFRWIIKWKDQDGNWRYLIDSDTCTADEPATWSYTRQKAYLFERSKTCDAIWRQSKKFGTIIEKVEAGVL